MPSLFSKIIAGDIPSYKVAEDEYNYAFLDINPIVKGHTLVVPKKEVDRLFDLEQDDYQRLMIFSKKISKAIETAFVCDRVGMAAIGLEVPHAHIHLMPISRMSDMDFTRPKLQLSADQFGDIARQIAEHL
jgi:Diadenosine tetraphosphate (Ap4A) hydrolase and other HIT family hydrolases